MPDEIRPLPVKIAVRKGDLGEWHTGTAIHYVGGRPHDYVTLCGVPVEFDLATQRDRQGIGFDGRGYGCGACAEAELRRHLTCQPAYLTSVARQS